MIAELKDVCLQRQHVGVLARTGMAGSQRLTLSRRSVLGQRRQYRQVACIRWGCTEERVLEARTLSLVNFPPRGKNNDPVYRWGLILPEVSTLWRCFSYGHRLEQSHEQKNASHTSDP